MENTSCLQGKLLSNHEVVSTLGNPMPILNLLLYVSKIIQLVETKKWKYK